MVSAAARGRHRGHPRRRLQPHRRGQSLGPDAVASAASTTPAYYRLGPTTAAIYIDVTGTGNTLNCRHPRVLQMVMDSLRYWVQRDARRRLSLRPRRDARARPRRLRRRTARFRRDPAGSRCCGDVKLIAEPWDIGPDGYQLGNFPPGWAEWNDRYTATACAASGTAITASLADLAVRLAGSADLFDQRGRRPCASINFITAHDGFTLQDLVSYNDKHNEANGEDNHDGHDDNRSWNCGAEGPTEDAAIIAPARRARSATCWQRCCCRTACRCCSPATRAAAARAATTTPIARTTRSHGRNGRTSGPRTAGCASSFAR